MKRIYQLIDRGEGEQLDFKKEITSVHRIARTMVSFANHFGGTLLVGINDNKSISGIRTEEERFMLEKAASDFCFPSINLSIKEWILDGKAILEVKIQNGLEKPYYAIDEDGKKWVYIRQKDQSMLASIIRVEVLKHQQVSHHSIIKYSENEKMLLDYLKLNSTISLKEFCKLNKINRWSALKILVNFVSIGILILNDSEKPETFSLK